MVGNTIEYLLMRQAHSLFVIVTRREEGKKQIYMTENHMWKKQDETKQS